MLISSLFITFLINFANCYNYLVYSPLFATSHTNYLANIADTLTNAGHNVTFFAPIMHNKQREKTLVKYTKDVVKVEVSQEIDARYDEFTDGSISELWTMVPDVNHDIFEKYNSLVNDHCAELGNGKEWKEILKSKKYDVFIYEPLSFCGAFVRKFLNIETVIAAPSIVFDESVLKAIGEPFLASITPYSFSSYGEKMNLKDRFLNWKIYHDHPSFSIGPIRDYVYESFEFPKFDLMDTLKEVTYVFTQSNPYIDFARPSLPKTIFVGGISTNMTDIRAQKLPKDLDDLLNKREKTIFMSFGSVILSNTMPLNMRDNLLRIIKSFPDVTFMWKYEDDDVSFADGIDNVHFSKWFPQKALLADPRLSAMLTHAGLSSTMEVAHCGVPVITVPIFADQMRNGHMLARHGGSINIDKMDLPNYNIIRNAIEDILYDKTYAEKAKFLSNILATQPFTPAELVVKHAEFAAKFKRIPQLHSNSAELNVVQYYLLDIAFIAFGFISAVLALTYFTIRRIFTLVHIKIKSD